MSVSNTTVHIAGAIGKETYLMLPQGKEDYGIGQKKMNKVFGISLLRLLNKPKLANGIMLFNKLKNLLFYYHVN